MGLMQSCSCMKQLFFKVQKESKMWKTNRAVDLREEGTKFCYFHCHIDEDQRVMPLWYIGVRDNLIG